MNVFFLLSILCLFGFFADENPDTTGQQSGDAAGAASGDADTGSIASLDDAMADATDEEKEPGARSDTTKEPGDASATETLILGKYKTPDDLAAAYRELEKKFHETSMENANLKKPVTETPVKEEWMELSGEQLATLETNDPEAYKWYLAEKHNREINEAVDKRLAPIKQQLAPLDELQKKSMADAFVAQENNIAADTKRIFDKEYEALDKQRQDVPFLQKLFKEIPKPLADAILANNQKGSPEYARQLLLGQIQIYNLRQNSKKKSMSINPDVGSRPGKAKATDSASTLEEAGNLAAEELGIHQS